MERFHVTSSVLRMAFWAFGLATIIAITGCTPPPNGDISHLTNTNIKKLYAAIGTYMKMNNYRGPKSKEELVKFFEENKRAQTILGRCGVDAENILEIFESERDGEPFVVRYGLNGVADYALVFEAVGVDGLRQVALSQPVEVDEETYDDYLNGKIEPARPQRVEELVAEDE